LTPGQWSTRSTRPSFTEIPDRGCPATEVTSAHTELSAIDEDAAQRDRSCLVDAAVEPDGLEYPAEAALDTAA
jgi:hypothetical protein